MAELTQPAYRVVVTGIGVLTPIGIGLREFWSACVAGKNGVGMITLMDVHDYDCRIGAEVLNFDPEQFMDKKSARKADRFTQFAVAASVMA